MEDVAKMTDFQLNLLYAELFNKRDKRSCVTWDKVQRELSRRATIAYKQKYPDIAPDAICIEGSMLANPRNPAGLNLTAQCPTCGDKGVRMTCKDLSSLPVGEPFYHTLWCESCYGKDEVGYNGHQTVLQLEISLVLPSGKPPEK